MLYNSTNPHGGDIYDKDIHFDFSVNTNPFGIPESVKKAFVSSVDKLSRYPDAYCRGLVKAIAQFEEVEESSIICGNGAAELIFTYCRAVRPRRALVLAPSFSEYSLALSTVGAEIDYFSLKEADNFDVPGELINHIADTRPDVVFLCNPNNPTGRLISNDLLNSVADLCYRYNIRLFVDECFLSLTDSGKSIKDHLYIPQVFILKAFTKNYALAGLRLGYALCSDPKLLQKMSELSQPWNISVPAQAAGVAALKETEYLELSKRVIRAERNFLYNSLSPFFKMIPSDANYILFRGPEGLFERLCSEHILIRDCSNYTGLSKGWYRMAVKLHSENVVLVNTLSDIFASN